MWYDSIDQWYKVQKKKSYWLATIFLRCTKHETNISLWSSPSPLLVVHQTSAGSPASSLPAGNGKTPRASGTWLIAQCPLVSSGYSQKMDAHVG